MSTLLTALLMMATGLRAHEVPPGIADLSLSESRIDIAIEMVLEAPLAGIDLVGVADTNATAQAEEYDRLRALPPDALAAMLRAAWPGLSQRMTLMAGDTRVPLELGSVTVGPTGNTDLVRPSALFIGADLPDDDTPISFGWDASLGPLVVREMVPQGAEGYTAFLRGGSMTDPIPRQGGSAEDTLEIAKDYIIAGFDHIIPKGLDHILFVLGLFFFALAWGPLLWQVSAFTVAHTCTLALGTLGIIEIPPDWMWLVEALIAASICYVAIENIFRPTLGWMRPVVVFCFGLLHGLGFASVLGDFGLPAGQFVVALLSFNVGVELGQLAVILGAFLILVVARTAAEVSHPDDEDALVRDLPVIYRSVSIVGSILIAMVGAWWVYERVFL